MNSKSRTVGQKTQWKLYAFERTMDAGSVGPRKSKAGIYKELVFVLAPFPEAAMPGTGQVSELSDDTGMRVRPKKLGVVDAAMREWSSGGKVKRREVMHFFRDMGRLLGGGIPFIRGLLFCAITAQTPRFRGVLGALYYNISVKGLPEVEAMSKFPDVFDSTTLALVSAGSESGQFSEVFKLLGERHKRLHHVLGKVKSGMMYPAFMSVAGAGAIGFTLYSVLPSMAANFATFGKEPPPMTKFLLAFSAFMQSPVVIAAPFVTLALLWMFRKEIIHGKIGQQAIRLPKIGALFRGIILVRTLGALAMLVKGGKGTVESLRIASCISGHPTYSNYFTAIADRIMKGESAPSAFVREQYRLGIDGMLMAQKVAVGSHVAQIESAFTDIADEKADEVEALSETLPKFIEPIIMGVIMGAVALVLIVVMLTNLSFAFEVTK